MALVIRRVAGLKMAVDMANLLDSDMDIDKFKDKWLEFAAEKILGDHANVKISLKDGKLNFDQTPEKVRLRSLN